MVVAHVIIVSAPLKIIGFFLCWCSWPSPTHLFVLTPMVMFERAMLWSLYLSYSSLHNLAKLWPQAPNESLWSLHNYVVDKEKWLHILSWLGHNQRLKLQKWTKKSSIYKSFDSKISILTLWIIKIYIKVMLIVILRFWGFQNCPCLSEYDKNHGFGSKMKLFFKIEKVTKSQNWTLSFRIKILNWLPKPWILSNFSNQGQFWKPQNLRITLK